ncbi:type II secretion system protein GspG [Pseudomonas monteilii]|jgi:general secretion pathway protein G|uniref:Type II secretion system core protein G n=2 Tax=Pseudomonas TaxID=286 RepID=A0A6G6V5N3_9PSED|nr:MULTISPECIES: type II secretion system major pseudopilin GspG [Pseudomonas]KPM60797.1 type II secretion system protein GspG [Pseudomonas putida]AVH36493.1 type II secretion system protein GspG [Pseudomonas monteilii]MBA6135731.1 type II secretion system major pseudopilin GspG [Pseudomonas monteilii]MBV4514383.1 type II secretion system major pseudopilin GspG [Pseudomonas kurunegalensis]MBZ3662770.1 type II secretion system major pseudopilin GspG [Pseudomonas monteilii]
MSYGFARRAQRGFTLIEIMVVVIILGVLGALVLPNVMSRPDHAKLTAARTDIQSIATALEIYRLDNGRYPTTAQGLEALVRRPTLAPLPRQWSAQGYLKRQAMDPWGAPYQYANPGTRSGQGYDLFSLGADGQPGGEDADADIGNWAE